MGNTSTLWIKAGETAESVLVLVYAQPGGRSSEVVGEFAGRLKIKISSPPVGGQANEALTKFIAERLGIKFKNVVLTQGLLSRYKTFEVIGLEPEEISRKLLL